MSSKRWTANQAKPKRYRPGKGEDVPSDESDISEGEEGKDEGGSEAQVPTTRPATRPSNSVTASALATSRVQPASIREKPAINEDEFETESEDDNEAPTKARHFQDEGSSGSGVSEEEEEEDDENESTEEEEESSEDEAPKLLRPTFIRKDQRKAQATVGAEGAPKDPTTTSEASKLLTAQSTADDPGEVAHRRAAADSLVQEQLDKQAAARAAGKKFWDDDEENLSDDVDDTDGLDPEAELAAWKLRELKRVKRGRDEIERSEREREELERRRNLTAEDREREDREFIEQQRADREGKGQAGYMKKYFHKGAFYQDEEIAEELRKRDLMGAKFADETSREVLPEYMQIRDMTKLGKKGRTRYKDLRTEDTGRWGQGDGSKKARWTGDERFAPDAETGRGPDKSGANAAPLGERPKHRSRSGNRDSRSQSPRRRHRNDDHNKYRSRSPEYRKRSRSPRYKDYNDNRNRYRSRSRDYRKRSRSPDRRDRYHVDDKRRRLDAFR